MSDFFGRGSTASHRRMSRWVLFVVALACATGTTAATGATTAAEEERLAVQYAPLLRIERPATACARGNGHLPIAVRAVVERPDVTLVTRGGRRIRSGPSVAQLAAAASDTALDLPGTVRTNGCTERRWEQSLIASGVPRTIYARVVRDPEASQFLFVQYWMYYLASDGPITQEGDWEVVQLEFATPDAAAALTQGPETVTVSQHAFAETQLWTATEVQGRTHPVVFPATGSNAAQFSSGVFLRSSQGCDVTTHAGSNLELPVTVLPSAPDRARAQVGWLAFAGRWGAFTGADVEGPRGPAYFPQWLSPWRWAHATSRPSVRVPSKGFLAGPASATLCSAITVGAQTLDRIRGMSGAVAAIVIVALALGLIVAAAQAWQVIRSQSIRVMPMLAMAVVTALIGTFGGALQWIASVFAEGSFASTMDTVAVIASVVVPCITFVLLTATAVALTSRDGDMVTNLTAAVRHPMRAWRRAPLHTTAPAIALTFLIGLVATVIAHAIAMWMTVATGWPFWVALPVAALVNGLLMGCLLLVAAAHRRRRSLVSPPRVPDEAV